MTDDTIRTKGLTFARNHLKEIAAYAIAAASMTVTASVALGHRQANTEQLASDVATLKTDVQGIKASVANTNVALATIQGTLNGISMKTDDFGKFKNDVQTGAKEALATPVPKLQGHRTRQK